ncbi:MAG: hydrogenase maturation protease, partial [Acidimicrobiales bacterium]
MSRHLLVAGIGNIFLGDDGFGPEVARRLESEDLGPEVRVADFGIRGVHLAYELLEGYDALVLVDAVDMGEPPGTLAVIEPEGGTLLR